MTQVGVQRRLGVPGAQPRRAMRAHERQRVVHRRQLRRQPPQPAPRARGRRSIVQEQEVLVVLVEAGDDVALDVVAERRARRRLGRLARRADRSPAIDGTRRRAAATRSTPRGSRDRGDVRPHARRPASAAGHHRDVLGELAAVADRPAADPDVADHEALRRGHRVLEPQRRARHARARRASSRRPACRRACVKPVSSQPIM